MAQVPSVVWCLVPPGEAKPVPVIDTDGRLDLRWTRLQPATMQICDVPALVADDGLSRLPARGVQALLQSLGRNTGATGGAPLVLSGDPIAGATAGAAAGAAGGEISDARLEEAVLRALKRARSDKVSISSFTARAWGHMSSRSGLIMEVCLPNLLMDIEEDAAAAKLGSFHWQPELLEPAQADRYMPYLKQLITLPGRTDYPLLWYQAGGTAKNLLDLAGYEDILYYSNITGNTDAAIITRVNYQAHTVRCGLCVLFELKKEVDDAAVYQALCELVVATILSQQWRPVVVLTDLMEVWHLFWINGGTVKQMVFPNRAAAVAVIKGCVDQAAAAAGGTELPTPQLAPQRTLPGALADRQVADLVRKVRAAAGAGVNPDLLDLADMLPAEEMQDVYIRMLLQQVSRLPVFSTVGCKGAVASMYS